MRSITLLACVFFAIDAIQCSPTSATDAVQIDSIDVVEYGIYSAKTVGSVREKNVAGGSWATIEGVVQVAQTNRVPAKIGTRFGFRYIIRGGPPGHLVKLKMLCRYPAPGLRPKTLSKSRMEDHYDLDVVIGESFTTYSFDEKWELVPGDWTFEIWWEGKKMATKSFTVFRP